MRTVPKVLGEGRSRLGQASGEGRLVEGGLVVQYRCTGDTLDTGDTADTVNTANNVDTAVTAVTVVTANTADNTIHTMHTTVQD